MDRMAAQLPNNPKQWTNLGAAVALLLAIIILIFAVSLHMADNQFIGADELKRDIQSLGSYTEEAQLLSQYTGSKATPRPYGEAYASALKKATQDVTIKLRQHPHAVSLDKRVHTTIQLSRALAYQLDQLSKQPANQLKGSSQRLNTISDKLKQVGQTL